MSADGAGASNESQNSHSPGSWEHAQIDPAGPGVQCTKVV